MCNHLNLKLFPSMCYGDLKNDNCHYSSLCLADGVSNKKENHFWICFACFLVHEITMIVFVFSVGLLDSSVQFSSVQSLSPDGLCDPMDCSTPGLPVHHQLPRIYSNSCPLSRWCHPTTSSPVVPFSSCPQSFPASESFQMSQLFASVLAKVLELQLQYQCFQWIFRVDFL